MHGRFTVPALVFMTAAAAWFHGVAKAQEAGEIRTHRARHWNQNRLWPHWFSQGRRGNPRFRLEGTLVGTTLEIPGLK
jgi:hypothetical protein